MVPNLTFVIQILNIFVTIFFLKKYLIKFLAEEVSKEQIIGQTLLLNYELRLSELRELLETQKLIKIKLMSTGKVLFSSISPSIEKNIEKEVPSWNYHGENNPCNKTENNIVDDIILKIKNWTSK